MKIETQVTSLELSKKLKELGVKQESLFIWYKPKTIDRPFELTPKGYQIHPKRGENKFVIWYPAFTVAELGKILPEKIEGYMALETGKLDKVWVIRYQRIGYSLQGIRFEDKSESNARAKMLIYLLENKLI